MQNNNQHNNYDGIQLARLYNQELTQLPHDLYIDPEALRILLEVFEGPLDLLLYLIRRQNLDILTIPIKEITEQYIIYINAMQVLNINLASEYLVMAATLLTIKSRLLLPRQISDVINTNLTDENNPIDPRQELINQLLEYETIKIATNQLNDAPQADRDYLWINIAHHNETQIIAPSVNVTELYKTWQRILSNAIILNPEPQKITKQELSVSVHMELIVNKLKSTITNNIPFSSLFELTLGINYIVVHFIAILELSKDGLVNLIMQKNDIIISLRMHPNNYNDYENNNVKNEKINTIINGYTDNQYSTTLKVLE